MSYLTKKECYDDVLKSLKLNIISYPDKELLLKYYEEDEDYSSEADDAESEGPSWDELEKRAYEDDRTAAQKRHQQNDEKDRGRRTGGRR
jgi:hypothetical protein